MERKKENFKEFLITLLLRTLTALGMLFIVIIALVMKQENERVEFLAAELGVDETLPIYEKRIPVKESMDRYIASLPVLKAEIPELEIIEMKEVEMNFEETVKEINVDQEEVITVNSKPAYSLSDKELLSQIMYAEEGVFFREYEKDPAKVERVHKLAGSVVLHRLENNYMGANSLADVLYAKGQYAEQTISKVEEGQDIPEVLYVWAEELITEGALGPKGMIFQAQFAQGEFYEQIGNQIFGVEPKYN